MKNDKKIPVAKKKNSTTKKNEPAKKAHAINKDDMDTVVGIKVIKAFPMTRGEYNDYRGWERPSKEEASEPVYLVEYAPDPKSTPNHPDHEGYISMSPKHVFDEAYSKFGELTFGLALFFLNKGEKIRRTIWPKGQFIFLDDSPIETSRFKPLAKKEDREQEIFMAMENRPASLYKRHTRDLLATDWEVIK